MNKKITRSLVVAATAGAVGAGTLLAAAPAHATNAGDLWVSTTVVCQKTKDAKTGKTTQTTRRLVSVVNTGGRTLTGVRAGQIGGAEITPRAVKADASYRTNGVTVSSRSGIKKTGVLGAGDNFVISQNAAGCRNPEPYAIVAYATAKQGDDLLNRPNLATESGIAPRVVTVLPHQFR
ncbi:MAG: hypothetical protein QM774_09360 [Gordonia sp. (in: high G+C Gram-positive bacteria)]|uniref:hypothetical protein n=1 Tax=Gordonia sp. (in: high G+C Gram-positive bacteria) TaxID=84139 RepID=UPI0039E31C8C